MCDLFFIVNEIDFASYADDNTPFVSGDRLDDALVSLENASLKFFDWFSNNQMKANPDKCHLLTSSTDSIAIKIKDIEILNSESEKLLGVTIYNKLNFNNHIQKILKKSSCFSKNQTIYDHLSKEAINKLFLITAFLCGCAIVV